MNSPKNYNSQYSFEFHCRQYFSLPFNLIGYLAERPSSINGYQNLQKTCKYFFAKKKIVVINKRVWSRKNGLYLQKEDGVDDLVRLPLDKNIKYWLTNFFSSAHMPTSHLFNINWKGMTFLNRSLPLKELVLSTLEITHFYIFGTTIIDENNDMIPWTTVFKVLSTVPSLISFFYRKRDEVLTSDILKNLSQVKLCSKLQRCYLNYGNIAHNADISLFCHFIKNNAAPSANILIKFDENISEHVIHSFYESCGKLLQTWTPFTEMPRVFLQFP